MIHPIDSAIIGIYLIAVTFLGIWIGRDSRDLNSYLLGGRNLPWFAVLGSIVATETSTATFLSVPGIAYALNGDFRFLQLTIGFIVGRLCIVTLLLPGFFRGELFTAYELLEKRFGSTTRKCASLMFLVARNLGDGLRLYLTGIALQAVTGFSIESCIVVIGIATITYTFFGGMKSVVWNDCLQFVIYTTGGIIAFVWIIQLLPGGSRQLIQFGLENDKLRLFETNWNLSDPYTLYSGLIGGACLSLGTHGTDQMMVQRYLCARSPRDARIALTLSGFVVAIQFALFLAVGLALACFYEHPPQSPFDDQGDRVFASFIVDELPTGVVGLCLASVFAAAMSTLSSSLNSSATATLNDFVLASRARSEHDPRHLKFSRSLTIVFGLIQIAIAIGAQWVTRSVVTSALAISGFTAGVLLGVFLLGLRSRPPQQFAVLAGMLIGIIAVSIAQFATPVAWPWLAFIGALATTVSTHAIDTLTH